MRLVLPASWLPSTPVRLPLPLAVGAFCVLWSSAFAVAKMAMADSPPLLLLTMRFLLGGVLMLGIAAAFGLKLDVGRRNLVVFAALGIANQAVYLGLNYVGMRSISSGLAALIISANPVLTAVLAAALLDERMSVRKVAGLLLGIGGVALIVQGRIAGGVEHWEGVAFSLAALVSFAVGTIAFKRFAPSDGLWVGNGIQSLAAGLGLAPVALALEDVGAIQPSWRLIISLAYLALVVSVLAYFLWFHLLAVSGATAASSYHFLMPPLGMLFGWMLLGEPVEFIDLVGIVPVALGIYLVTRPPRTGMHATPR